MPNPIKYSISQIPNALGTNDMWLGVNDNIIFPPTDSTGWWSGYSPGASGYTIFIQKPSQGPSIYSPANDSELITTVYRIAKARGEYPVLNTVQQALSWISDQNEMISINFDYPSIVTNGLVFLTDSAFTASYPKGGTAWKDISGSEKHATLINGPTYSSQNQGILDFDSALLQYATGPDLGTLSNFTVSCWVKLTTLPTTSGAAAIVTNVYDLSTKLNFSIGLNRSPTSANICFGFFNGAWRTTNGFSPSTNTWYNITGTYDGSVVRQYVNGIENTTLTYSGTAQSSGLGIRIGRRWDSPESSADFIDGQIPVVKIYNRALSPSEVLQNYNALIGRFPQPITTTTTSTSTTTTTSSTSTTSTTTAPPTSTTTTSSSTTTTTTSSGGTGPTNMKLLVAGDTAAPNVASSLRTRFESQGLTGYTVSSQVIGTTYTGSDLTTANYNVVLYYTNSGQIGASSLSTNLKNYVASGGNLVTGTFVWNLRPAGLDLTITPFTGNTQSNNATGNMTIDVVHPITTGINTAITNGGFALNNVVTMQPGSTKIASFTTGGQPYVGIGTTGASRFVGINTFLGLIPSYTNMRNLTGNAVLWAISYGE